MQYSYVCMYIYIYILYVYVQYSYVCIYIYYIYIYIYIYIYYMGVWPIIVILYILLLNAIVFSCLNWESVITYIVIEYFKNYNYY